MRVTLAGGVAAWGRGVGAGAETGVGAAGLAATGAATTTGLAAITSGACAAAGVAVIEVGALDAAGAGTDAAGAAGTGSALLACGAGEHAPASAAITATVERNIALERRVSVMIERLEICTNWNA